MSAPPPPVAEPIELSAAEVYPNAKRVASEVARALTTYEEDDAPADLVAAVVDSDHDSLDEIVAAAAPLFHAGAWSRGKVVYPQLGGVRPDRVSVMVVVEQTIGLPGETRVEVRTLDVRLRLRDGRWVLGALASAGGSRPVDPPPLSPEAEAVLDDERIQLSDSARWDILSGGTDPGLLRLMARIAERTPYAVVVLSTGHPFEVFGTDRQSNHTLGRAVDIYRLGDGAVIDDHDPTGRTRELVGWLFDDPEVAAIGSPWALDGYGGRSFTDVVHADHLHVAIRAEDI